MSEQSVPITIDVLSHIQSQLEDVIEEIEQFGVGINPTSRLPEISALLRETVESGEFPSDHSRLALVGDAIRTAQEFIEIANVLPDEPVSVLQEDLGHAIGGPLQVEPEGNRQHLQFQSQLWVGAMMVQGGASAGVLIRSDGKNPDFILDNGLSQYAVEVKRPEVTNAKRTVRRAAAQIRSERFHGGMIVVDLTDAIDREDLVTIGDFAPDSRETHEGLVKLTSAFHDEIFANERSKLRLGREHVFGLIAFARAMHWDTRDLSQPYLSRSVATVNYWRRDGRTLRAHRARWLGHLIHDGIIESGHNEQGMIDLSDLGGGTHGA